MPRRALEEGRPPPPRTPDPEPSRSSLRSWKAWALGCGVMVIVLVALAASSGGSSTGATVLVVQGQYAIVRDTATGVRKVINTPGPYELQDGEVLDAPPVYGPVLTEQQFLITIDGITGRRTSVKGPQRYLPCAGCAEYTIGPVEDCTAVTADTALVVHSTRTSSTAGGARLVTSADGGLFCPEPHETITGTQPLIHLAGHQSMAIQTAQGSYIIRTGEASFFVPVNMSVHTFSWSVGPQIEEQPKAEHIYVDHRVQRLRFDYGNVEFAQGARARMDGVILWQVQDLEVLLGATADPTGDIWHRVRSRIMEVASAHTPAGRYNLTAAMAKSETLLDPGGFYAVRGVALIDVQLAGLAEDAEVLARSETLHSDCASQTGSATGCSAASITVLVVGIVCLAVGLSMCLYQCFGTPPRNRPSGNPPNEDTNALQEKLPNEDANALQEQLATLRKRYKEQVARLHSDLETEVADKAREADRLRAEVARLQSAPPAHGRDRSSLLVELGEQRLQQKVADWDERRRRGRTEDQVIELLRSELKKLGLEETEFDSDWAEIEKIKPRHPEYAHINVSTLVAISIYCPSSLSLCCICTPRSRYAI